MGRELAQGMNQPRSVAAVAADRQPNQFQRDAIRYYGDGDFRHLLRRKSPLQAVEAAQAAGECDTLFLYIVRELGNASTAEEATSYLNGARNDIEEMLNVLAGFTPAGGPRRKRR